MLCLLYFYCTPGLYGRDHYKLSWQIAWKKKEKGKNDAINYTDTYANGSVALCREDPRTSFEIRKKNRNRICDCLVSAHIIITTHRKNSQHIIILLLFGKRCI